MFSGLLSVLANDSIQYTPYNANIVLLHWRICMVNSKKSSSDKDCFTPPIFMFDELRLMKFPEVVLFCCHQQSGHPWQRHWLYDDYLKILTIHTLYILYLKHMVLFILPWRYHPPPPKKNKNKQHKNNNTQTTTQQQIKK